MKPKRYPIAKNGDRFTPIMRGYKVACCDCGLVHRFDFDVIEQTTPERGGRWKGRKPKNHKRLRVALTVHRDNRATGQIRRWRKAKA